MKANYFRGIFYILIVFILCIGVAKCKSNSFYRIVETNDGKVRGVLKTTLLKQVDYYSFRGIPYAKPPTGELRFKVSVWFSIHAEDMKPEPPPFRMYIGLVHKIA